MKADLEITRQDHESQSQTSSPNCDPFGCGVICRRGGQSAAGKVLDTGDKDATRFETSSSMIGYRNTLVFYTFPAQKRCSSSWSATRTRSFPFPGRSTPLKRT